MPLRHPSTPPRLAPSSELATLAQLEKALPNDYLILHGVHWSNAAKHRTAFGEIDFVIVNRAGRILVIEQKNGWLHEDEHGLVKEYGDGAKRVSSQMQRSIGAIRSKFAAQHGKSPGLEIDNLIYCPDHRVIDVNAAGIDMSRTMDAPRGTSLATGSACFFRPARMRLDGKPSRRSSPSASASCRTCRATSPRTSASTRRWSTGSPRWSSGSTSRRSGCASSAPRGSGKSQLAVRFVERALGIELELRNPLPGLGAEVHTYDDADAQAKLVAHRLTELVKLGFRHEDIAVVSCRGIEHALFAGRERLGSLRLRRFTGKYDSAGRQLYTDGRIGCDTIFRFKGQQAPAVILADVDETLADSERTRAILYCGMTRATVRLEIAVHEGSAMAAALREAAA